MDSRAGFELTVYDLRDEPLRELAGLGAHVAASPREVGERSEIIETATIDIQVYVAGDSGMPIVVMQDMHDSV